MQRNSWQRDGIKISPVEDFSLFAGFSCLQPQDTDRDLDDFIRHDAARHYKDRIAVTYLFEDSAFPGFPLAFATLQNDSVVVGDEDDLPEVRASYPYSAYPAVKIGRLGVHIDYQRNRIGTFFLNAIKELMLQANRTGCRFITVDARRDKKNNVDVTHFYERNGFSLLPCRSKTSRYIPMYFDLGRPILSPAIERG